MSGCCRAQQPWANSCLTGRLPRRWELMTSCEAHAEDNALTPPPRLPHTPQPRGGAEDGTAPAVLAEEQE